MAVVLSVAGLILPPLTVTRPERQRHFLFKMPSPHRLIRGLASPQTPHSGTVFSSSCIHMRAGVSTLSMCNYWQQVCTLASANRHLVIKDVLDCVFPFCVSSGKVHTILPEDDPSCLGLIVRRCSPLRVRSRH